MRHENGSFQIGLLPPVTVGNDAHAWLGVEQAGLDWVLPQVDDGGPKARHHGLPVTTLKKRLKGVGGIQGVRGLRYAKPSWVAQQNLSSRRTTDNQPQGRREKRNGCDVLWRPRSHQRVHENTVNGMNQGPHPGEIWTNGCSQQKLSVSPR